MRIVNSFVALFDFLGFKALRKSLGTEALYGLYARTLLPQIEHAAAGGRRIVNIEGTDRVVPDPGPMSVRAAVASDTILLFADSADYAAFCRIVCAAHALLCSSFCGHKAPLRGAVGWGDLVLDDPRIWVGSAIEDAYAGASSQVWAGCSFTEAAGAEIRAKSYLNTLCRGMEDMAARLHNEVEKRKIKMGTHMITEYDIPVFDNPKSGAAVYATRRGLALDWTTHVYEGASVNGVAPTDGPHASKIIENTRAFETWARTHNR